MSSKRTKNRRSNPQPRRSPQVRRPEPPEHRETLREAALEAALITEGELAETQEPSEPLDEGAITAAWTEVAELHAIFRRAVQELESRGNATVRHEEELAARLAEAAREASELAVRTGDLAERERALLDGEHDLLTRQEEEKASLLQRARETLLTARREVEEQQHALAAEHERTRTALRADLDMQRDALAEQASALKTERGRLRTWETSLVAREEDLEDARQLFDERLERASEAAASEARLQCVHLETRNKALLDHAGTLRQQLDEYDRTARAFNHRSPEEVLAELEELRSRNTRLAEQPTMPEAAMARLADLEEARRFWHEERTTLIADNEHLRRRLQGHQITAMELERLNTVNDAAESTVRSYRAHIEDLRRDIEVLTERKQDETAFPQCSSMDSDYADPLVETVQDPPDLEELTHWLHEFVADRFAMYYSVSDLATFFGGLAASRLHLLQGISGIGKTQLPLVVARALGAQAAVVPVTADWRTPQDLVGYFNAFERRFYESEFTQAVYRAGSPTFQARPFFVVLDEMNLSHPEQYFSEVLYQLGQETRPGDPPPSLTLMTTAVRPAPDRFADERKLVLPPNLWFLGTANHDETTVAFADKTYDRAHVIELPSRPQRFRTRATQDRPPLSLTALNAAFGRARQEHRDSARTVAAFLDEDLTDRMLRDFQIASGSRSHVYLNSFVPVARAAGVSESEAADFLFASRLLRKLHGRFEIPVRSLKELRDDLPQLWRKAFSTEPDRSLRKLDDEIRLRGDV
ncbi:AAA family ATPase [Actinocorallia longicatena]|uniref:ATPase dynein-related AAA domain-containing protein n=1 Tax=Actinocorallia longicatena TaxID=111803 RepID=A0ABP6Q2H7_9ACTN